jgi:hypothetical protein
MRPTSARTRWIGSATGAVERLQHDAPLRGHRERGEDREERRPRGRHHPCHVLQPCAHRRIEPADAGEGDVGRPPSRDESAEGEARIAVEDRERRGEGREPDRPLGGDPRQEDALEADLLEPEPVGEAARERGEQEEADREERQGDGDDSPRGRRRRAADLQGRGRTDAGLPQAADERIVVFRWQLAHWSEPVFLVGEALADVQAMHRVRRPTPEGGTHLAGSRARCRAVHTTCGCTTAWPRAMSPVASRALDSIDFHATST